MLKYKIIFSPEFSKMFKDNLYLYKSYSSTYASKIKKKIRRAITLIQLFPYATPSISLRGITDVYRRFIINKKFILIFKITDDTVYFLYFFDARQNFKKYF